MIEEESRLVFLSRQWSCMPAGKSFAMDENRRWIEVVLSLLVGRVNDNWDVIFAYSCLEWSAR